MTALKDTLHLALLGAGTFASTTHQSVLTSLTSSQRLHVTLIWSRTSPSATALSKLYTPSPAVYYQLPEHDNPDISVRAALAAHPELDVAILALPPDIQPSIAALCLHHGLHVLQEKPLALNLATARNILQVAKESRRFLAVAENYRFEPALQYAKQLVSQIGGVIGGRMVAQVPMPEGSRYGRAWRLNLDGLGILVDGGVHFVAGLRLVVGPVNRVSGICQRHAGWFKGFDTVTAIVQAAGHSVMLFVTYACNIFTWEFRIVGRHADVVVERLKGRTGYRVSLVKKDGDHDLIEAKEFQFGGIEAEFQAFFESIRSGSLHPFLDPKEAFADLATMCALFDSSAKGETVAVEEVHTCQ